MTEKAVLLTHFVPRDTNSGGEIAAAGIAASLDAAGYQVEAVYCGKPGPAVGAATCPTWDCSAPSFPEAAPRVAERVRAFGPAVVWVYGVRAWPAFRELAPEVPHVLLAGDPPHQIERLRFRWEGAAAAPNPARRVVAWGSMRRRVRALRLAEAEDFREAARHGIAAAYGPGDVERMRRMSGVDVVLCELGFPDFGARRTRGDGRTFLLLGNLNTLQTRYGLEFFMRRVWPAWRESPLAERSVVRVVGGGRLPSRLGIRSQPGLELVGFVEDLDAEWERATAMLVPIPVQLGFRTRLVEAWARAMPVVTDASTAAGLPGLEAGRNCLVVSSGEEWVGAALRLLDDPALAATLGEAGRAEFLRRYLAASAAERFGSLSAQAIDRWSRAPFRAGASRP